MDDAVQTVMTQCELWTDNDDNIELLSANSMNMGKCVEAYANRLTQYVDAVTE